VKVDHSVLNWEEMYQNDELDTCRVPELKKYLRSVRQPLSGNKKELLLRVKEHIQQQLTAKKAAAVKMEV
jgi:hypothetical protein